MLYVTPASAAQVIRLPAFPEPPGQLSSFTAVSDSVPIVAPVNMASTVSISVPRSQVSTV